MIWYSATDTPSIAAPLENTSVVITEGSTISITCEAVGYPPPTTVWNRTDGSLSYRTLLSDEADISFGNSTVSVNLTLTNANREDTGLYQCTASNNYGSDEQNISITVHCKYFSNSVANFVSIVIMNLIMWLTLDI